MKNRKQFTYDEHMKVAKLLIEIDRLNFEVLKMVEKTYGISSYPVKQLMRSYNSNGNARSGMDNFFYIDGYGTTMPNPYYRPDVRGESQEDQPPDSVG